MIRTTNDVMRSLLLQASHPTRYWVESLHTATYLLNLLPTKAISTPSPHFALFCTTPSYAHIRVFRCASYPNLSTIAPHKLAPHSSRCVFLGYSSEYQGYQCLDLSSNRIIISHHIIFDGYSFPFASPGSPPLDNLDILFESSPMVSPIAAPPSSHVAGTSMPTVMPHAAPMPSPTPHAASALQPVPHTTPAVAPPAHFTEPTQVYQRRHPTSILAPAPSPVSRMTSCSVEPPQVSHRRQVAPTPASSRVGPLVYHPVPVTHDPRHTHSVVTRRAAEITKPVDHLQLSTATSLMLSPIPTSVRSVLANPHWWRAMQ
jgi:hypothetical protein